MTTHESAKNQDPTLYCAYFGGPRDGLKTGDLPAALAGKKLTGMVSKMPLSQPHQYSLYAVYVCTSETQVDGFWVFEYQGVEGPNGEKLVAGTDAEEHGAPIHDHAEQMDTASETEPPLDVPIPHPSAEFIDIEEFNRRLHRRLDEPVTRTIGDGALTEVIVIVGHTLCQLDPSTTTEGAMAYLQRISSSEGVYAVVPATTGDVRRVVAGRKVERIPGFYLYAITPEKKPRVLLPTSGEMEITDIALLILEGVAVLHRRGHQRLRVYPNVSGSGLHWRAFVADIDHTPMYEDGPFHWPRLETLHFAYSTAGENDVVGMLVDSSVSPEEMAEHILSRFPNPAETGLGRDWSYVGWYSEMLNYAKHHHSLPVGDDPRFVGGAEHWPFLPDARNTIEAPPPWPRGLPSTSV